jgi:hypothetical protein
VTYRDLLFELCREDADAPCHHELAFLVARPEWQVLAALKRLRSDGLASCLELDLEPYGALGVDGRWVSAWDPTRFRDPVAGPPGDLERLDLREDIGGCATPPI